MKSWHFKMGNINNTLIWNYKVPFFEKANKYKTDTAFV